MIEIYYINMGIILWLYLTRSPPKNKSLMVWLWYIIFFISHNINFDYYKNSFSINSFSKNHG
jgi:hypothetical protein